MTGAPAAAAAPVSLRPITAETVRAVCALEVAPAQRGFVASNAFSLAQALFAPQAWYPAVYAGETPCGFVMLYDPTLGDAADPVATEIGLWRFMVDARFQGRGVGKAALGQVVEHVRGLRRFTVLRTSYVPGPGCPEPFYRRLGFRPTGAMDGREIVLALPLDGGSPPA